MEWKLADAKNRFSELVNRALSDGPQRITRRDDTVIVLSEQDYDHLVGTRQSFKDFLLQPGPTLEGLDLDRDRFPARSADS